MRWSHGRRALQQQVSEQSDLEAATPVSHGLSVAAVLASHVTHRSEHVEEVPESALSSRRCRRSHRGVVAAGALRFLQVGTQPCGIEGRRVMRDGRVPRPDVFIGLGAGLSRGRRPLHDHPQTLVESPLQGAGLLRYLRSADLGGVFRNAPWRVARRSAGPTRGQALLRVQGASRAWK